MLRFALVCYSLDLLEQDDILEETRFMNEKLIRVYVDTPLPCIRGCCLRLLSHTR